MQNDYSEEEQEKTEHTEILKGDSLLEASSGGSLLRKRAYALRRLAFGHCFYSLLPHVQLHRYGLILHRLFERFEERVPGDPEFSFESFRAIAIAAGPRLGPIGVAPFVVPASAGKQIGGIVNGLQAR